uniref:Protein PIGBOS1 n=2 Tax=Mastacembelus armatus TaxID=205130 RepID=A0A7N8XCC9_9TELE
MLRRRIPFTQMALATMLGVAGGVYIYRPYFEQVPRTSQQKKQDDPKKPNETE